MSIEKKVTFPFSPKIIFDALQLSIREIRDMNIKHVDEATGTTIVKVNLTLTSWGEEITIEFLEHDNNKTVLRFTSLPKAGADNTTKAKSEQNILTIAGKIESLAKKQTTGVADPGITIVDESTSLSEINRRKSIVKKSNRQLLIGLVILVSLIYGCNKLLCTDTEAVQHQAYQALAPEEADSLAGVALLKEHGTMAYIMAQDFVKDKLVSPGSADFPFDYDKTFVYAEKDSVFTVVAYVDSQNSFGALMRTFFKAKLKYNGGDNWFLQDLKMEQKE